MISLNDSSGVITTDLNYIYRKLGTGKPWAWHCRPILAFWDRMYAEIFVSVEKLGDFIPIGSVLPCMFCNK